MSSFIYFLPGLIAGIAMFSAGLAARAIYDRLRRIVVMDDDRAAAVADKGDDWAPFPWLGRDPKPGRTSFWVIPPRQPLIEVIIDQTRPAWHSGVGVELAGREVSK